MPVSAKTAADHKLPLIQARVLAALVPAAPGDPPSEWPWLNRAQLAARAGYTALSGSITRAFNGIKPGSSSGDPHPGLIAQGLVEEIELDVEGVREWCYRATPAGLAAYRATLAACGGALPPMREREASINRRYLGGQP